MLDSIDTLIAFVLIMLVVSLLVTVTVQMLGAALNLRGFNVAKGLACTLSTIHPDLGEKAATFADNVLSGQLLSDSNAKWLPSFWRRATAVRADEVFDSIYRTALGRRKDGATFQEEAKNLLRELGLDELTLAQIASQKNQVDETANQLTDYTRFALDALPPREKAEIDAVLAKAAEQVQLCNSYLGRDLAAVSKPLAHAYQQFEYWFNISQERADQWFTMHTRFLSVGLALVFAFWFQLDAVEIFRLVSTNRTVRDALVAQTKVISNQAERTLTNDPSLLEGAFKDWRDHLTDEQARQALANLTIPSGETRGELRRAVGEALSAASLSTQGESIKNLDEAIDQAAGKRLQLAAANYNSIKPDLDQTGFEIYPSEKNGRWGHGWSADLADHSLGMFFSAALLSLGAPFWYNLLKNLASLRSTVAENISKEQKQGQSSNHPEGPANPPPTVLPLPQNA